MTSLSLLAGRIVANANLHFNCLFLFVGLNVQALKQLFYDSFGSKSDYEKNSRNAVIKTGKIIIKFKNGYALYRTIFLFRLTEL